MILFGQKHVGCVYKSGCGYKIKYGNYNQNGIPQLRLNKPLEFGLSFS